MCDWVLAWDLTRIRIARLSEEVWAWIAWRLPRSLVMWAAVRLMCHATTGKYEKTVVPELTAMDALRRWSEQNKETPTE